MTRRLSRTAAASIAAVLVSGGLASCADDAEDTTAPSSTSTSDRSGDASSSPSASSSTSPEAISIDTGHMLPPVAGHRTTSGAEQFALHYVDILGRAGESGDTTTLKSLGASECTVCTEIVDAIDTDKANGLTLNTNPYTATDAKATGNARETVQVTLSVEVEAHKQIDSSGATTKSVKATTQTVTGHMEWTDGWEMTEWTLS